MKKHTVGWVALLFLCASSCSCSYEHHVAVGSTGAFPKKHLCGQCPFIMRRTGPVSYQPDIDPMGGGLQRGYWIYHASQAGKSSFRCAKCRVVFHARWATGIRIKGPTRIFLGREYRFRVYGLDASGQKLEIGWQSEVTWRTGKGLKKLSRTCPICHRNPIRVRATAVGPTQISVSFRDMTHILRITVVPSVSLRKPK